MTNKRKIEVFSTGCSSCDDVVQLVERIACPSCEVEVLDVNETRGAERAEELGVRHAPAIAVDGRLAGCCTVGDGRITEEALRAEGVGQAA